MSLAVRQKIYGFLANLLSQRMVLTVVVTLALSGVAAFYVTVVNPMLNPGGMGRPLGLQMVLGGPVKSLEMAERYLPHRPWTADAKYRLRTADAFVYFEEWEPVGSDKSIRFQPFAVIWIQHHEDGSEEEDEPITIVAESAYVNFASEFSISDPNPGRVIGGALEGDVFIKGANGLSIEGRNFAFSEDAMRLWCDNPVRFTQGPHDGNAHGLQVELIPDDEARRKNQLAVAGVKSMQLRKNVTMNLEIRQSIRGGENDDENRPRKVRIQSAGSFNYFIKTHVATFEDQVRVHHPDAKNPHQFDSLKSDRLTLLFEPAAEANADSANADSANGSSTNENSGRLATLSANLTFRQLQAAGKSVVLISEGNELTARMKKLTYDAKTKVAAFRDHERVHVVQGLNEMRAPEIILVHNDEGEFSSALCQGAGWMKRRDAENNSIQFAAQWSKRLQIYPDPDSSMDIIELEQQALVRQPEEQIGLAAEFIRIWVDRNQQPGVKPNTAADNADAGQFRVKRLLGLNNVAMVSPDFQGETKRLEIWFVQGSSTDTSPQIPLSNSSKKKRASSVHTASYREANSSRGLAHSQSPSTDGPPLQRRPETPKNNANTAKNNTAKNNTAKTATGREELSVTDSAAPAESSDGPIEIVADLIRVRVLLGRPREHHESQISEVWTEGNVRVRQEHAPGEEPLRVTGDRLHVVNRSEDDRVLHVYGKPANIRDRRLRIEGREIHFDRRQNLAWVRGAGLLELPVDQTLDGEKLKQPELLDVWWKEQMRFDGKTAEFFGDVETKLNDSNMFCQEMQVILSRRISFSEQNESDEEDVDVERVICKDGVEFKSQEYEGRKLMEVRHGHFAEFHLNQQTGKTNATGPGWITVWRRGRGRRAGLSPQATAQANQPLQSDRKAWEYIRIDFAGQTHGNLKSRFTTFQDRVQIAYGPVETPLATIDIDNLPKNAGWMKSESLRFTQHEETEESPEHIELFANGNAKLEGQTFNARADTITFDESKGLYTLRSIAPRKATIWRQKQLGGDSSRADAQRMEFIPSKNHLKFDRTTGLDGLQ